MISAPRVNVAPTGCSAQAGGGRRVASAEPSCGAVTHPARGAAPTLRVLVRQRHLVVVAPEQAAALREQPCPACGAVP